MKNNPKYKVLIVDDNSINLLLIYELVELHLSNVKIFEAKNGKEACDLYFDKKPDIVLMDLYMPIMNGYDATVYIREKEKSLYIYTPIIAITSGDTNEEKEKCFHVGMDDFFTKPISSAALTYLLDKYLIAKKTKKTNKLNSLDKLRDHFDKEKVLLNYRNNEDFVNKLLEAAFKSMPSYLDSLKLAFDNNDNKQLKFFAHMLKGMSMGVYFNIMSEYFKSIEIYLDSDMSKCKHYIDLAYKELEFLKKNLIK